MSTHPTDTETETEEAQRQALANDIAYLGIPTEQDQEHEHEHREGSIGDDEAALNAFFNGSHLPRYVGDGEEGVIPVGEGEGDEGMMTVGEAAAQAIEAEQQNIHPLPQPDLSNDDIIPEPITSSVPVKRKATSRANMLPRGGACDYCKRRKLKCSAEQPKCAACIRQDKECVYSQKQQRSKVRILEDRLRELEKKLGEANAAGAGAGAGDAQGSSSGDYGGSEAIGKALVELAGDGEGFGGLSGFGEGEGEGVGGHTGVGYGEGEPSRVKSVSPSRLDPSNIDPRLTNMK